MIELITSSSTVAEGSICMYITLHLEADRESAVFPKYSLKLQACIWDKKGCLYLG